MSSIYFCLGLSCCPYYYQGERYSRVHAWQELTVFNVLFRVHRFTHIPRPFMESFATYPIISIQSYKKNIKYHNYYISVQRKSRLIDFCDRASELCDKLAQWTIFFAPIIIIHYYNNTLPHYTKHIFLVHSWPLVLSRPHCLDIYVPNPDNQDN